MKYDNLVEQLGELGPYQKRVYFLASLPCISAAIHALTPIFILAVPDHRCVVPGLAKDEYKTLGDNHRALINYTLPWTLDTDDVDDDEDSDWQHAQCYVYKGRSANNLVNASQIISQWGNDTITCNRWVYDDDVFDNSFVTQEGLVCGDKVLRSHANMIYMCGLLVGSIGYGYVSDRLGRKTAFLTAVLIHVGTTIALSFADSYVFFVIFRFIIGTTGMGIFMCCFVLGMELLGTQYRAQGGIAVQFFWVFGMFVLDLLAYFIRDWRHLQLVVSCYTPLYLLLYWFVPESPRWQISQGQLDKAKVTMEKVAKANGKELPKDAFADSTEKKEEVPKGSLKDLFASPVLLMRALVVFINWCVVTMVYYGLTLNVGSLGGSIYVNFAFSGAVEGLGNVAALFGLPVFGRKKVHCFSMLLGGFACLACMIPAVIDTEVDAWVTVLLSNIGKFGATGGFSTIYVYTAELFPTFMRNSVVGASSMVARLGGIAAPYIADLGVLVGGQFGTVLPYVVFGACSVLAGLLALTLPETLNMGTPETMEEAEHFGKTKPNSKNGDIPMPKYEHKEEINYGYQEDSAKL